MSAGATFLIALLAALLGEAFAPAALAQSIAPALAVKIDAAVRRELARTGTPGASIAIVRDGQVVLARAYGLARLSPQLAATADQRFPIGSISKQFTAAAALLLVEDGRLDLDAPVDRLAPEVKAGPPASLRQALGHTAGYLDYWPQDFAPDYMLRPITPDQLLRDWAARPADFAPGTDWRYSNTGFVLAAEMVRRAAGVPLSAVLQARVFTPLSMGSVRDLEQAPLGAGEVAGYTRWALGPPRPAPREALGWLTGAGQLSMSARDLAQWDLAVMNQTVLSTASWAAMERSGRLANGRDTGYGLGLHVGPDGDTRLLWHGGALSGFLAVNRVWPDLKAAIVVLTNSDYGDPAAIADRIGAILPLSQRPGAADVARARVMLTRLASGRIAKAALTPVGAAFFTAEVRKDFADSLRPLGRLTAITAVSKASRGGLVEEVYAAAYGARSLRIVARRKGERYEQFSVLPR